jgi:hypothetical protein
MTLNVRLRVRFSAALGGTSCVGTISEALDLLDSIASNYAIRKDR